MILGYLDRPDRRCSLREPALDAAGKSPKTICSYFDSVRAIDCWLANKHMAPEPEGPRTY
jgi:hypothetical protein